MDNRWLDLCAAQHVPVLNIVPGNSRFAEVGCIFLRDRLGSVLPLGCFDICDRVQQLFVFPCHTLNMRDEEQLMAVAAGLMMAWNDVGLVTFRFAIQQDGSDYALLETVEGMTPAAKNAFALRQLSGERVMGILEKGEMSELGLMLPLTTVGLAVGSRLYQGLRVSEIMKGMPEELLNRETISPWYARFLTTEETDAC